MTSYMGQVGGGGGEEVELKCVTTYRVYIT